MRESGVLGSVVCDQCDEPHSAQVVHDNGGDGYFCPELGFTPLSSEHLTAYLPDVPLLVNRLAEAFACRQRKSSSLYGRTWRIGVVMTAPAPVMLYFHPTLKSDDDARDLQNALGREAQSDWRLVVTSQGSFPIGGCTHVRLDDLIEIDVATGALRPIADPSILAGVPRKNTGGRPSEHRHLLKPLIEERIQTGESAQSVNAEALAVRAAFQAKYPDKPIPSDSSIKRYIRDGREGS